MYRVQHERWRCQDFTLIIEEIKNILLILNVNEYGVIQRYKMLIFCLK